MSPPRSGFEAPDSAGCQEKPPGMTCFTDAGKKGACTAQQLNVPDFSQPGPPRFEQKTVLICVHVPPKYSLVDYAGFVVGALILFGLVAYNMTRKKTLADYP